MARITIGIHGLGNKPESSVLEDWWLKSIKEGLAKINSPLKKFKFELVYWADIMHPMPENLAIRDKEDEHYIREPYIPAAHHKSTPKKKMSLSEKFIRYIGGQLDRIFLRDDMTLNFNGVTNHIIRRYFKDLQIYFSKEPILLSNSNIRPREAISNRLIEVLKKHQRDKILLIAHSMGSIIAYDVLINHPELHIDTFVTIGSPLGLPIITSRLYEEKEIKSPLTTPDNISNKWYNMSDPRDYVALDYTLGDDYSANKKGLTAEDINVVNDYHSGLEANPHKAYGYLRCFEMAHIINDFNLQKPGLFNLSMSILKDGLRLVFNRLRGKSN